MRGDASNRDAKSPKSPSSQDWSGDAHTTSLGGFPSPFAEMEHERVGKMDLPPPQEPVGSREGPPLSPRREQNLGGEPTENRRIGAQDPVPEEGPSSLSCTRTVTRDSGEPPVAQETGSTTPH